ncbi:class I SAM-dependent methyltransferase [Marinilabilia rubra]|uniref:Methyltransferase type 11 n=1 Tax=Marinilabilia rubra TaxID=2162893 RepID=A0A2U2BBS5_9BACT|nr:class I SAM-dependent methyltransferase [Marinilabilia rubra]PWE00524.1 methyltransferase type 11 [Marinilabilia rubra]
MQYDPIKRSLGRVFNATPGLRVLFYRLLNLLLLRSWYIRRELKKWARSQGSMADILDAGSGFGQYSWFMSKLGRDFRILGVDVKEEQVEDCNRFFKLLGNGNRVTFQEADLTRFSNQASYDLVLSVDVMEHIEEDRKVFYNFFESLTPGGMLLISTPSDKGGSDAHHDHEGDGISGFIDEHVRDGYSPEDISEKLQEAGFENVECRYSYGIPGHISWKLTMKTPILLLNKSKVFFILLPFYYLLVWPFAYLLNFIDVRGHHKEGTGLLVKAFKPAAN